MECQPPTCPVRKSLLLEHEYPAVRCICKRVVNRGDIEYFRTMVRQDPKNGGQVALDNLGITRICCIDNIMNVPIINHATYQGDSTTLLPKELGIDGSQIIVKTQQHPFAPGEEKVTVIRKYKTRDKKIYEKHLRSLYTPNLKLIYYNENEIKPIFDPQNLYKLMSLWAAQIIPEAEDSQQIGILYRLTALENKVAVEADKIYYTYILIKPNLDIKATDESKRVEKVENGNVVYKKKVFGSKKRPEGLVERCRQNIIFTGISLYGKNYISRFDKNANFICQLDMDEQTGFLLLIPRNQLIIITLDIETKRIVIKVTELTIKLFIGELIKGGGPWLTNFLNVNFPDYRELSMSVADLPYTFFSELNLKSIAIEIYKLVNPKQREFLERYF